MDYVKGLFNSPKGRANCYFMANRMGATDGQNLNHMLTHSPWEHGELFKMILTQSIKLLRTQKQLICILMDEVGHRKKGKHSACVGRQYLGSIGKHDNGQVAVASALSAGEFYCPVEMGLFMPQDWEDDLPRRKKAGIPESVRHQSKTVMALRMIKKLYKKLSKDVECVVFDALYGNCIELLKYLVDRKVPFVGDVKKSQTIYLKQPQWGMPAYSGRGPWFTKRRPTKNAVQPDAYFRTLGKKDFTHLSLRNGTKGAITALYHMCKVWVLHPESKTFLELHLPIRKDSDGKVKYSFGFFNDRTTMKRMAKAQGQRVYVERVFEEGKNSVGMGDYQTRSWTGFHRHAALSSLALLFLMEQKIKGYKTIGKITAYHIQELANATIRTLSSLDQIIQRLSKQIPEYQHQIQNQLKLVT